MAANNALGLHALTNLSSQLKTVDHTFAVAIRRNLRNGIKQQGATVLGAVKEAASWSSRIPPATGLSIRYNVRGASVRIQVDHNRAPHARPYEVGNRRNFDVAVAANGGYKVVNGRRVAVNRKVYKRALKTGIGVTQELRFPVFHKIGEPGGFGQVPTRPFFFPTIARSTPGIDQAMERVVIQTARDAGFR